MNEYPLIRAWTSTHLARTRYQPGALQPSPLDESRQGGQRRLEEAGIGPQARDALLHLRTGLRGGRALL